MDKKRKKAKKAVSKGSNGNGRDKKGRFSKGCKGGPGNPYVRRLAEYRKAINDAVTPEDIRYIVKKIVVLAKSGSLVAAKELLDRAIGRAAPCPSNAESFGFELPTLATTADTVAASNAILKAMSEGRITTDDAAKMAGIVELARRTLETHDLARRLETLENEMEEEDD